MAMHIVKKPTFDSGGHNRCFQFTADIKNINYFIKIGS